MKEFEFSVFGNGSFVDLMLYQAGREQCSPSHSFGPAARRHYLFHYIIKGSGRLVAHDGKGNVKTYELKGKQGFMLFPGQISMYIADETTPWEYIWIEFDGLRAKELTDAAGFSENSPIYNAHTDEIRAEMAEEMKYIAAAENMSEYNLTGHMYLFTDCLVRSAGEFAKNKGNKLRDRYVGAAIAYIEKNFREDITIEDIAAHCGLNRSYFGKIFKEVMSKSPQEFLIAYRMIKAAELLKGTRLPIGEISAAVGYENQLHFSRAFKNTYNISPREWRNRNKPEV